MPDYDHDTVADAVLTLRERYADDAAGYEAAVGRLAELVGREPEGHELSAWEPYHGPHGGKGWKNQQTGDVVYGDRPGGGGSTPALREQPSPAPQYDEGRELARWYAQLLDALEAAGVPETADEVAESANDELDGTGWAVTRGPRGWVVADESVDDDDEDAHELGFTLAAERSAGDVWQGKSGRWFKKRQDGRTVPTHGPNAPQGKTKERIAAKAAAGPADRKALAERLAKHGEGREPNAAQRAWAKGAARMFVRHHGEEGAAHRIEELAGTIESVLGKVEGDGLVQNHARGVLKSKLAQLHLALREMPEKAAEKPAKTPQKPAEKQQPSAPKAPPTPEQLTAGVIDAWKATADQQTRDGLERALANAGVQVGGPGFTGTDALGREWRNGELVAADAAEKTKTETGLVTPDAKAYDPSGGMKAPPEDAKMATSGNKPKPGNAAAGTRRQDRTGSTDARELVNPGTWDGLPQHVIDAAKRRGFSPGRAREEYAEHPEMFPEPERPAEQPTDARLAALERLHDSVAKRFGRPGDTHYDPTVKGNDVIRKEVADVVAGMSAHEAAQAALKLTGRRAKSKGDAEKLIADRTVTRLGDYIRAVL